MPDEGTRRSDRVYVKLCVEALGTDADGREFAEQTRTLVVSRHGGVLVLKCQLNPGQNLTLRRIIAKDTRQEGRARVVGYLGSQAGGYAYGVAILDPEANLWGIEFPSVADSEQAFARMLLECSNCRRLELGYLNEIELNGFGTSRAIARQCKTCKAPTVWTQALQDYSGESEPFARSSGPEEHSPSQSPEEEDGPDQTRLKTRLRACIREPRQEEELAVCENISRGGLCFRSRKCYPEGTHIEIAVPYAAGSANVFVRGRIVYVKQVPAVGIFRHGVEYIRDRNNEP